MFTGSLKFPKRGSKLFSRGRRARIQTRAKCSVVQQLRFKPEFLQSQQYLGHASQMSEKNFSKLFYFTFITKWACLMNLITHYCVKGGTFISRSKRGGGSQILRVLVNSVKRRHWKQSRKVKHQRPGVPSLNSKICLVPRREIASFGLSLPESVPFAV